MLLPFELDPQIIHHIIHNQAGSIGKAIIELIMNSVDAEAKIVRLSMNKDGFICEDDGKGFDTKEDVIIYFGRFGTPHQDGDATYGRFRLGRGQIMAHASTTWISNSHLMIVDTMKMGYHYDYSVTTERHQGCRIDGIWYDPLTETELLSTLQEIRDLVRYTPAAVELNGRMITRDPKAEKWDYEDDYAYYRVKLEGAVSIYNQGVLVRHDAAHLWGAGGLIVTKKAISLNVSRTEILRKTCDVWKEIVIKFERIVRDISVNLSDNRKTEARREKAARSLLSGEGDFYQIVNKEEVITILPGNRHISLEFFFRRMNDEYKMNCCIVENHYDIPKAESMARAKIALFIHPRTLERFGVYSPEQFLECLELISDNLDNSGELNDFPYLRSILSNKPILLDYHRLSEAFVERIEIVKEKDSLDRETRRVWTALRWCLQQYAGACLKKSRYKNGRVVYGEETFAILVGRSNTAEAWTDGESYIAFNVDVVKRLKGDPLKTAAYIFSLLEHEIAHEGDSLDVGHDEVFYQRYHDISITMSSERQRYMHIWLMKYTNSLEQEGKKSTGLAWSERLLIDRVGNGRQRKGLPRLIEDVGNDPILQAHIPEENLALIKQINEGLVRDGLCSDSLKWDEILRDSLYKGHQTKGSRNEEVFVDDDEAYFEMMHESYIRELHQERERVCDILGISAPTLSDEMFSYLEGRSVDEIKAVWSRKPWDEEYLEQTDEPMEDLSPHHFVDKQYHILIEPGETQWTLERNAAAAGFHSVEDYLLWRGEKP